jgi:hypothetical protein
LSEVEERFWFTHWTREYHASGGKKPTFEWLADKPPIRMDWDNCTLEIIEREGGKVRFAVRSKTLRKSDYMGGVVVIRYMLAIGVDPASISEPRLDRNYSLSDSKRRHLPGSVRNTPHDRWVLVMGEYEIWQWTRQGVERRSSAVYRLYESIMQWLASSEQGSRVLKVDVAGFDKITPVVYQPAVDSLDNFLREIHCVRNVQGDAADIDVSLVFNNEQLRRHRFLDGFYRWFRKMLYGRTIDIETFTFHFVRDRYEKDHFIFKCIYSDNYNLVEDDVHEDRIPQPRPVHLYFFDQKHPAVFVNTSNHALAGHDNNRELWKWEYVGWAEKPPVVLGERSRTRLYNEFKSPLHWS